MQSADREVVLSVRDLEKGFGGKKVLSSLSLSIRRQSIFGLLGPNGAGKTTLIRIVVQILSPDAGEILFNDRRLAEEHKALVGYMPEERGLYGALKVIEQLVLFGRLRNLSTSAAREAAHFWTDRFGMSECCEMPLEQLSKGMQQKIQFIATVIHNPQFLIFDEPFSGLDPINTELFKAEIPKLREAGKTVLLSTHNMNEVEEMCDEILLINRGRTVLSGPVREIKNSYAQGRFRVEFRGELGKLDPSVASVEEKQKGEAILKLAGGSASRDLLRSLTQSVDIVSYVEMLPSLRDIFVREVADSDS